MVSFLGKIRSILSSSRFYWFAVAFLAVEGLWIALSAVYPMAFDEEFHFGVIKIYSEQLLPFLASQPEGANQFGALVADPSYLYHYLMSFPYRFISLVTDSQAVQVIFLRLLNIAVGLAGVVLFRKVLLRAGISAMVVNSATLLFALIPTVPLLIGQINYDNLMLLTVAATCWLVLRITEDVQARTINPKRWALLAVLLMLSSLVKYPFLPVALAAVLYLAALVWWQFRGRWQRLGLALKSSCRELDKWAKVGLLVLLFISGGLFVQRYGANMVRYGSPVPDCDKVLSVQACMEFGPFGRNYRLAAMGVEVDPNPLAYTWTWLQGLHYRLFFVINGPPQYINYPPAILPSATAVAIFLFSLVALLFYWRQVFRGRPFLVFLLIAVAVYATALWLQTYSQYLETSQPVAINGRYFIPLLFPMIAVAIVALGVAFRPIAKVQVLVAAAVILLFLQGGGVFSFILRSDEAWYWPNQIVRQVNLTAQEVLSKVMFVGPKGY